MTKLTSVVAISHNMVIGKKGGMPWGKIPEDLARFRKLTIGKPVIMGRKTYDSIGKPLDGRLNIVLTRHLDWSAKDVVCVNSVQGALDAVQSYDEASIIGGAEIYKLMFPFTDCIEASVISSCDEGGDTFFPSFDGENWRITSVDAENSVVFVTYRRFLPVV